VWDVTELNDCQKLPAVVCTKQFWNRKRSLFGIGNRYGLFMHNDISQYVEHCKFFCNG